MTVARSRRELLRQKRLRKLRRERVQTARAKALRRWAEAEAKAKLLIEQLRNEPVSWKRDRIGSELAKLGAPAAIVIDDLIALLKDKDRYVRREVDFILGTIGPDAKRATKQLGIVKNTDKQWIVRRAAGEALNMIHRDQHM